MPARVRVRRRPLARAFAVRQISRPAARSQPAPSRSSPLGPADWCGGVLARPPPESRALAKILLAPATLPSPGRPLQLAKTPPPTPSIQMASARQLFMSPIGGPASLFSRCLPAGSGATFAFCPFGPFHVGAVHAHSAASDAATACWRAGKLASSHHETRMSCGRVVRSANWGPSVHSWSCPRPPIAPPVKSAPYCVSRA